MKAFVLCAGSATRLRPLTHGFPKPAVPFLNLPLLCYNWFYLEEMGLSRAVLNSHLFPEILRETVRGIKTSKQGVNISFELKSLGSAGGLFSVKSFFEREKTFLYLNGDSLFFPSKKSLLKKFAEQKLSNSLASLWAVPFLSGEDVSRALWIDRDHILRAVGGKDQVQEAGFEPGRGIHLNRNQLRPVQFTGLALFKGDIYKFLSSETRHIFSDTAVPLLREGLFKVFLDEEGLTFEGGMTAGLLFATAACLKSLFSPKPSGLRDILRDIFQRFDPTDERVGLNRGLLMGKKKGAPLLCPESVKDLSFLEAQGFAVLGREVFFVGKAFLHSAVLGEGLSYRGPLRNQILIKFPFPARA